VNVGAYAPFNAAWERTVGTIDRRPTAAEIAQITALLESGARDRRMGVSAGLDYKPGPYYAKTDEVVTALAHSVAGARTSRTMIVSRPKTGLQLDGRHPPRHRDRRARGSGAVITHMKLQGREQGSGGGARDDARATRRGVYTAATSIRISRSRVARRAAHSRLGRRGRPPGLVQRLRDSTTVRGSCARREDALVRPRVRSGERARARSQPDARELMPVLGTTSPGEAIARVLEQENPGMIATFARSQTS